MTDYGHDLLFGYFLTPDASHPDAVVELARFADRLGLDILGVQDHPYQPAFLDMWTLLSVLAAETQHIRLVPDVANLPLRPPAVLAGAVASLDILSGGRVELGLGSGGFARAAGSLGAPQREPGEAVDALAEAVTVMRLLWSPGGPVSFNGRHYSLRAARPGPFPVHSVGIWLGAYKPRMLRLTGRLADGWIPSLAYASPDEIGPLSATIDEAARGAGRDPRSIRRVYNISGRFSETDEGLLQGPPGQWIAQLTDLALDHGFSAFVLGPGSDPAGELERFALQVAPGVREAVAAARQGQSRPDSGRGASAPPPATSSSPPSEPTSERRSEAPHSPLLPDEARPHAPSPPDAPTTAAGRASRETLVQVHDHLRHELTQIQQAAADVAAGQLDPGGARALLNRMTIRQNDWTLGAFCAQYCRVVTLHHTIEDRYMFPALRREDEALSAVLDRLHDEHEIIAEVVDRFDTSLVAMMTEAGGIERVRRLANELGDALLSHLAYEEDELLGPLGRSSIAV